jgi:hypothetical protein
VTNPFFLPIDLLVTIRAFTRERIGNGGCEHQTGRYPDQLSLTGLRLGRGTILVLFARAGAAAGRATTRAGTAATRAASPSAGAGATAAATAAATTAAGTSTAA